MKRLQLKRLMFLWAIALAATILVAYLLARNTTPPMLMRAGIPYAIPRNPPIKVSFLSRERAADGTRVARFSISNHTARAVEYEADASSQPRYSVLQLTGVSTNGGKVYYNITNHNSGGVGGLKSLKPGASVICLVRIPPGATNEMVLLHYMPRQPLADRLNSLCRAARLSFGVGRHDESYPLWEPFEAVGR